MNLGENIYKNRTLHGMSQGDLANALDVSRQSVSKWENNSAVPELDKLMKLARLFGVTLDELVNGPPAADQPAGGGAAWAIASGRPLPPTRIIAGSVMLLFGMVFFLLSIFWGNHLRIGEELGEIISASIVFMSIALLGAYSRPILTICAVVYAVYAVVCVGIMNVTSINNYLFMSLMSMTLLVWFIVWGMDASGKAKDGEADGAARA